MEIYRGECTLYTMIVVTRRDANPCVDFHECSHTFIITSCELGPQDYRILYNMEI